MANNYTQFSFTVDLPPDARTYAAALLAVLDEWHSLDPNDPLRAVAAEVSPDSFNPSIRVEDFKDSGLWISADESGDLEITAGWLQAVFRQFDLPTECRLEWASTCSKPRIGEFGGGVVLITKDDQKWMNTSNWVAETDEDIPSSEAVLLDALRSIAGHTTEFTGIEDYEKMVVEMQRKALDAIAANAA